MIGFFPELYPDELLYSACARYAERLNYPNKHTVKEELFGSLGISAIIDFPTKIERLLRSIYCHEYSVDDFINKHTLFLFYEPFLTQDRTALIREEMKDSSTDNRLKMRLATNINQVKSPIYLRFCPLCLVEDREKYGETYWHRMHQLAGILVCSRHRCFLDDSSIKWEKESSYLFHCAENLLSATVPRFLDEKNNSHRIFLTLADNASWLLSKNGLSLQPGELRRRYYNILLKKGFAFYNGKIRSTELFEAFTEFYTSEVLEELGCQISSPRKTWLPRLVDKTYAQVLYHPIRHLLFLNFLEIDLDQFFAKNFDEFKPFYDPPYPCLNRASNHYKELIIQSCKITDNTTKKLKQRRPVAIFTCDCGFVYQRAGPDTSFNDRFSFDLVRDYGQIWEENLKKQWANLNLSLSEIGRQLGVASMLIARHAIRLNLPMNTKGTRTLEGYDRHRNPQSYLSEHRESHRKNWLEVSKRFPDESRLQLMNRSITSYLWLQKNDSEWFEQHLPKPFKVNRKVDQLNWEKIDNDLFKRITEEYTDILQTPDILIRASMTEIIRRVGYKKWIDKRHLKLPKITRLLDEIVESLEDFMIRKIEHAKSEFIKQQVIPTKPQFIHKAIVKNSTTKNSAKVRAAINQALIDISNSILKR